MQEFKGYLRCELTDQQKVELKGQSLSWEEASNTLTELLEADYRVTLKYDTSNSCFQALMSSTLSENEAAGWTLAARGSEPLKALKQLFYKHYVMLSEQWGQGMRLGLEDIDD